MRAWRVHQLGDPTDVLTLDKIPEPTPGHGEVVVEVAATSLNFPDILLCKGMYQVKAPLPFVPARELAGRVVETGSGTTTSLGTRVIASPEMPSGGLMERVAVAESSLYPMTDALGFAAAAALPTVYYTAHLALHHRARLARGETVLVLGGSGGVGTAAIQVAKAAGCRVLATATGDEKMDVCRRMGADVVIDYKAADLVAAVREATQDHGADVVIDPIGGDLSDSARRVVAWEGRMVVLGFVAGRIPQAPTNHLLVKNYGLLGFYLGSYKQWRPDLVRAAHDDLLRLAEDGAIAPAIYRTYAFEAAREAFAVLQESTHWGKVVVEVSSQEKPGRV
jgi:NADPH2:quinone reductase